MCLPVSVLFPVLSTLGCQDYGEEQVERGGRVKAAHPMIGPSYGGLHDKSRSYQETLDLTLTLCSEGKPRAGSSEVPHYFKL